MKRVELLFDTIRSPYDIAHIIQIANAIDCVIYTAGKNSIPFDIPKVVSKVKSWNITGKIKEIHYDTFEEAIKDLRSKGKYLIGTSGNSNKIFYDLDLPSDKDIVVVFGTETSGLTIAKQKMLDETIKLPMDKSKVDFLTLPVAVSAIGYGKYIVIAPSMNQGYFNHPITQENIAKINSFGNVSIIYPEYIYKENGELDRITMAPWEKILDSICHKYNNIRYENKKVDFDMSSIIDKYFPEFFSVGKFLQENQYTNGTAGFIARKIPEGILITSTGSSVGALSRGKLTLILDCKAHIVSWSGNNMPSSETPLVIELFNSFPLKQ